MTRSIAVVGAGPRGTGILERLVARASGPLDVHVIDPFPPGAGRIWRRDQDTLLWMNSVAADVAMLPDDADVKPTLAQWVLANRENLVSDPELGDEVAAFESTSFASRSLQSHYLAWVFESTLQAASEGVRIHVHRASVVDLTESDEQCLVLDDGTTLTADVVVLAQGHPDSLPSPREVELAALADDHGLVYVGPGYTADLDPSVIPEAEPVLVSGLGLAFVDWMVLLAESRGGVFTRDHHGDLTYTASGREPVIYAGSRRGVPYHAKISYPIAPAAPPLPRFFAPDSIPGDGVVDFRDVVWPAIVKELAGAHYHELFRSHPDRVHGSWSDVDAVFATREHDWSDLVAEFVPDPADRFDIRVIDRPLAGETYDGIDHARRRVHEYIEVDLRRRADPRFSPDAAVFTALLSVYRSVGELVRTDRLSSDDVAVEVEGRLHSFFSFVASGPPPERLEQLLALGQAGVVRFLGPDAEFSAGPGGFTALSASHPDVVHATAYIEARLPIPSIARCGDALLRTLHARGDVREIAASPTSPAKLAVDGQSRLLDSAGTPHLRRYAVGPWVAGHTWSSAFARPGIDAGFFRHNDAIAAALLVSENVPVEVKDHSPAELPILDLGLADTDPDAFRIALREAAHGSGFFYLTGHGISAERMREVTDVAREFFELPADAKAEISQLDSPHFRGYSRLGGELTNGLQDWREQVDLGPERPRIEGAQGFWNLQGPNLWPSTLPRFREVFERWDASLSRVGLTLLRHWAASLGAPSDHFDAAFADAPATLIKVVRYPGSDDTEQGVGAHKDSGVLTLLLLEPGSEGLQVESTTGEWVDAPPMEGAFVVNIGELLEVATDGYLRATRHRVRAPRPGTQRISVPYFLNPALDAVVPTIDLPPDLAERTRGVETDPDNPIFDTYGANAWKSRTRAHPDVAARHHA